jgi:hypothetical protein
MPTAADEVKFAEYRREFVVECEGEHGRTPPPGLTDLVAISNLICERTDGPKRPTRPKLVLIHGGRDDA